MGGAVRVGAWTLRLHRMESDRLHMQPGEVAVGGKHACVRSRRCPPHTHTHTQGL